MNTQRTGIALCQECRGWTDDPDALAHGWTVDGEGTVRCRTCSAGADGDDAAARRLEHVRILRDQLHAAQADIRTAQGQVAWLAAHLARLLVAWHDLDGTQQQREVRYFAPAVAVALDALAGYDDEDGQE